MKKREKIVERKELAKQIKISTEWKKEIGNKRKRNLKIKFVCICI
jgi:hypothetical protein